MTRDNFRIETWHIQYNLASKDMQQFVDFSPGYRTLE